ncbi:hypothetical protein BD560DRAFT_440209 [Blakeslea trispora]|nr:hypothetical protein BD560DRAFT_440209 [Blakeslea trispora]
MSSSNNDNNNNNDENAINSTAEGNFSNPSKEIQDVDQAQQPCVKRGFMSSDRKKTAIDFAHGINIYGQKWNERGVCWADITYNVNQVDSRLTDVSVKTVRDFVRREIVRVYKEQEAQRERSGTLGIIDAYTQKCLDMYEKHLRTDRKNAKDRLAEADVIAERRQREAEMIEQANRIRSYRSSSEMSRHNPLRRSRDWDNEEEEEEDSRSQRIRQTLQAVPRNIEAAEESVRSEHRFLKDCLDRMEGFTNQIVQSNEKLLSSMKGSQQSHATMAQSQAVMAQNMDAFFRFMAESRNAQAMDRKVLLGIQQSSLNNQQTLIELTRELLALKKAKRDDSQLKETGKGKGKGKGKKKQKQLNI